jgi:hypothetical protein
MIAMRFWRLLALMVGLLGVITACADNGALQDPGGASHDSIQPRPERGGGGGGGGGY